MKETEKEENELLRNLKNFNQKLMIHYMFHQKIRSSVKNGLAVVPVERGASAGSFL